MKAVKGTVIGLKMHKTATVLVERFHVDPSFGKRVQTRKKYHAGNDLGAKIGQTIEMTGCRPLSKTKKWQITKIVAKNS